jgi:hypothetical protein
MTSQPAFQELPAGELREVPATDQAIRGATASGRGHHA